MYNHNELAIIKDGILTLDGNTCGKVYRMLGMCVNPGKYNVNATSTIEEECWVSDGFNLWMEQKEIQITNSFGTTSTQHNVISNKRTRTELLMLRIAINNAISHLPRYYEVKGSLYRLTQDTLFYLREIKYSGEHKRYKENKIPMSVIDKILHSSIPISTKTHTMVFNDRRESVTQEGMRNYYENGKMSYFGYTDLDGYYVRIDYDETICIEVLDNDNSFNTLYLTFDYIKEIIVTDYLQD
jgi:hypothetical protein